MTNRGSIIKGSAPTPVANDGNNLVQSVEHTRPKANTQADATRRHLVVKAGSRGRSRKWHIKKSWSRERPVWWEMPHCGTTAHPADATSWRCHGASHATSTGPGMFSSI